MAELPLHIIENILLRSPVKSLIRFRCVCKTWRTLISHPHFVRSHLRLPQTQARTRLCIIDYSERGDNHSMVVRASTKDCEAFSDNDGGSLAFDYLFDIGKFKYEVVLLDSCDGLLCIADLANKIVLWNPSTRQCNQLPPNPNVLDFVGCHGFGYDSFADDYKISVVPMLDPNIETVVDVFSLKSNKWKRIQEKHHTRVAYMCATVLHVDNKEKLVLCDLKENTYKNIMPYGGWFQDDANLYVETLVSPHPSITLK